MKDLTPEAKAILDLGADADEPTAADRDRVRRAVAARIGVGIAAGAAVGTAATKATAGTATAAGASVSAGAAASGAAGASGAAVGTGTVVAAAGTKAVLSSVAAKVIVGLALATGGGAAIYEVHEARSPKEPATAAAVSTPTATATSATAFGGSLARPSTSTEPLPSPLPSPETSPSPIAANPPPTEPAAKPAPRVVATAPVAHAPTTVPAPASTLSAEAKLLAEANEAIQNGQASVALDRLDEHQHTYPAGVLSEERAATRVLALCAAGRETEARNLAATFLAQFPRSPYVPRIESSCARPSRP